MTAWTLIADFVSGTYERNGNSVTLADILAADGNWGGYSPSHVQSGVGLVNASGSASKPVIVDPSALLVSGFIAQCEFDFVQALPAPGTFQINALELPGYSQEFDVSAWSVGAHDARSYIRSPDGGLEITGLPPGVHVLDYRFEAGRVGLAVDGGQRVDLITETERTSTAIGLSVTRGILRSLKLCGLA